MPLIPAGFAQVNFRFTGNALPTVAEMTFGVVATTVTSPSAIAAAALEAWEDATIPQYQSGDVGITSVLVKVGPNSTGPSAEVGADVPGTSATAAAPPNVAGLIKKATASGGRSARGRFYMPGLPEGQIDGDGQLSSTWFTGMQTAFTAFLAGLDVAEIDMVVLHSPESPISGVPVVVTDLNVDPRVATQRRRLRR